MFGGLVSSCHLERLPRVEFSLGVCGISAEIILYQSDGANVPVQVRYMDETLWLTQAQIAELFGVQIPNISKHLGNVYEEGELDRESTVSKMEIVRTEGARTVRRKVDAVGPSGED